MRRIKGVINLQLVYVNVVVPNIPTRLEDEEKLAILNCPCLKELGDRRIWIVLRIVGLIHCLAKSIQNNNFK